MFSAMFFTGTVNKLPIVVGLGATIAAVTALDAALVLEHFLPWIRDKWW
ncbi:hypothetical protein [Streptomyces camponoticapitis]|nr:hypothetical protein [Streptomyces camponoticapitis]